MDSPTGIQDLPPNALHHVFSFLDTASLFTSCTICRAWSQHASDERLWWALARATWPEATIRPCSYGGSIKRLVLCHNRENAVEGLGEDCFRHQQQGAAACLWRENSPRRYYEARITGMELQRLPTGNRSPFLRVYYDARGEQDLRHGDPSTLRLGRLRRPLQQWPAAVPVPPLALSPLREELAVYRGSRCVHAVRQPGHVKGCVEFDASTTVKLLRDLATAPSDAALLFIFADINFAIDLDMPAYSNRYNLPDYAPVVLWAASQPDPSSPAAAAAASAVDGCAKEHSGASAGGGGGSGVGAAGFLPGLLQLLMPGGGREKGKAGGNGSNGSSGGPEPAFLRDWRQRRQYFAPGELLERMRTETEQQELQRWQPLPSSVEDRNQWLARRPTQHGAPPAEAAWHAPMPW